MLQAALIAGKNIYVCHGGKCHSVKDECNECDKVNEEFRRDLLNKKLDELLKDTDD